MSNQIERGSGERRSRRHRNRIFDHHDAVDDAFLRHGFTGYPVTADGRTLGVIRLADVQRCPPEERQTRRVEEFMQPLDDSNSIGPEAPLLEALRKMNDNDNGRLLVMTEGRLVGLLTRSGIARFTKLRLALGGREQADHGALVPRRERTLADE